MRGVIVGLLVGLTALCGCNSLPGPEMNVPAPPLSTTTFDYDFNLDSQGWTAGFSDYSVAHYVWKLLQNPTIPVVATADAAGKIWVFVGTDSGFEGRTTLYYSKITVTVSPDDEIIVAR